MAAATGSTSHVEEAKKVMEQVYGRYTDKDWTSKSFGSARHDRRYLWSDAFGVVNFLSLFHETGDQQYLDQADAVIEEVHNVLGRTRDGSARLGAATDATPTLGGLRIGKADPEGTPDGDGQYMHYNTKWMYALNRMAYARNNPRYNEWAIQMAKSVHPHFVYRGRDGAPHMVWKTTIDMSRPAVASEGNLDPYDALVTYRLLEAGLRAEGSPAIDLKQEIAESEEMVRHKYKSYRSHDPLDLGESLWLSHWGEGEPWADTLSSRAAAALEQLWAAGEFAQPEQYRLAFRECGTMLGVQVNKAAGPSWRQRVAWLHDFWRPRLFHRDADITPLMYASSLLPGVWQRGYSEAAFATA